MVEGRNYVILIGVNGDTILNVLKLVVPERKPENGNVYIDRMILKKNQIVSILIEPRVYYAILKTAVSSWIPHACTLVQLRSTLLELAQAILVKWAPEHRNENRTYGRKLFVWASQVIFIYSFL